MRPNAAMTMAKEVVAMPSPMRTPPPTMITKGVSANAISTNPAA
jgi:hypothetical protein